MAKGPTAAENMTALVGALVTEFGFVMDGQTRTETFKIITSASYPLAGALITLGGRDRFARPDGWFVTVGKRNSCVYRKNKVIVDLPETPWRKGGPTERWSEPYAHKNFPTKDLAAIRAYLEEHLPALENS